MNFLFLCSLPTNFVGDVLLAQSDDDILDLGIEEDGDGLMDDEELEDWEICDEEQGRFVRVSPGVSWHIFGANVFY